MKKKNALALLMKWGGKDKYKLIISAILGMISGLMIVVPYMATYKIIEGLYSNELTQKELLNICIVVTIAIVIKSVLKGFSGLLSHISAFDIMLTIRKMIIDHISKIPMGYVNERRTGEFKKIINEDVEKLELFLAHRIPELFSYLISPIVLFIYFLTVDYRLALISLIPIPIAILIQVFMYKGHGHLMDDYNSASSNLNSSIIEYIKGMKLIKAYNLKASSFRKYSDSIDEYHNVWSEISKKMSPLFAIFHVMLQCGILVLLPVGGFMYLNGQIIASTLILFVFVGTYYLSVLRPLMELAATVSYAFSGLRKVEEIMNIPVYKESEGQFPKDSDIEFKNVYFSYDNESNVLNKVNLKIKKGQKLALVGKSGAGKTSALQLIARYYSVTDGDIFIGGKNIKDINYNSLLDNMSIVFQDTFLVRGSVLDNIKMGVDGSDDEVISAAKKAQIHDFILSLPNGYNTEVGSQGVRFSGGEKQRIAIARAIFKDSPILLLDEATSAADPENQLEIEMAIDELCKNKTVVVVAHRLDIVKKCDKIAVVENNSISEIGTHLELLESNKYYKNIWDLYERSLEVNYKSESEVIS